MGARSGERTVHEVLAAHGRPVRVVRPLGAGLDHAAYAVDDELVVRVRRDGGDVAREARLLEELADALPLPVPRPVLTDPGRGVLAYRRLQGRPALGLPGARDHAAAIGATLGRFVSLLHTLPSAAALLEVDDAPLGEWLEEARSLYPDVSGLLPEGRRDAVEAFLAARPPDPYDGEPVPAHNDLGTEHVLVDPATWQVTGIIDWSDAALTDPARDLALLYRDLGPDALRAAAAAYRPGVDRALLDRARFYARCGALEDLAYGREPYVATSLRSLDWLFPEQHPFRPQGDPP